MPFSAGWVPEAYRPYAENHITYARTLESLERETTKLERDKVRSNYASMVEKGSAGLASLILAFNPWLKEELNAQGAPVPRIYDSEADAIWAGRQSEREHIIRELAKEVANEPPGAMHEGMAWVLNWLKSGLELDKQAFGDGLDPVRQQERRAFVMLLRERSEANQAKVVAGGPWPGGMNTFADELEREWGL